MSTPSSAMRKGARRMSDVPPAVLAQLVSGDGETVNLMEWLAVDMSTLALRVAAGLASPMASALEGAATKMAGMGITDRLRTAGDAIASADRSLASADYNVLRSHRSDLVRQWACYAVNSPTLTRGLPARLEATLEFASDSNMSVREAAWMAFRPHLASNLEAGLQGLEPLTRHENPNVRRFAIEVTRPRSVWGAHLDQLKRSPETARPLLENVKSDPSRYVQLAVGNWLNDASKSRPDWTADLCRGWRESDDKHTEFIVRRGERTLIRAKSSKALRSELF